MLGVSLRLLSSNRIPPSVRISTRNSILVLGLFEEGFIKMWDYSRIKGLASAELFGNSCEAQRGREQLLEPGRRLLEKEAPSERRNNFQSRDTAGLK